MFFSLPIGVSTYVLELFLEEPVGHMVNTNYSRGLKLDIWLFCQIKILMFFKYLIEEYIG